MIAVVDYGMGNLRSVCHAFERIGAEARVAKRPEDLREAERIVLPGVGAFGVCMSNLRASGLIEPLREEVFERGKPFLGICLGLQVLSTQGEESGLHEGLDWIPGKVKRFDARQMGLRVPHVGWNEVHWDRPSDLFHGLRDGSNFYFVHSYYFAPQSPGHLAASAEYGIRFAAAALKDNLFATQFHPEKSQDNGLRLLENFLAWRP